jgi:hypothetical protein
VKKLAVVAIITLCVVFAGAILLLNPMRKPATVTTVAIIADYKLPNTPNNNSILCDFIKVVKANCEHIFINPTLWSAFLEHHNQGLIPFDATAWEFFDTELGLIYMRNRAAVYHDGILHQQFKRIIDPLDPTVIDTLVNRNWTTDMHTIFNIPAWQAYHADAQHKSMLYMSGHGARRAHSAEYTSIGCGILSPDLVHIASFFNTQLTVTTVVINSCYWTADRLRQELQQAGVETINFTIISPLLSEQMLWLTADPGCQCAKCVRPEPCFFDTCRTFTGLHEAAITPELATILCSSDTVTDNFDYNQTPTLVIAGSAESISIQA